MKQNIDFQSTNRKVQADRMNTTQIKNVKYWSYLIIWWFADMLCKNKLQPIITELVIIIGRKLNMSRVFITKSYFNIPKNIGSNYMYYFIKKTPNKQELQQIGINHSWDIDF